MASGSKKVIIAALIGNALIAISKFIAAVISNSSAMLSEGIHSLVDTGNQVLLLLGLKRAKKPADENYPFGHGKEIYFWSFVVAILIFAVGAGISIYEGVHSLIDPHPIKSPIINYIVLGCAILFEGGATYLAWKEFNKTKGDRGYVEAIRKSKNPSLFVVLFEDSAAMLGLFVALTGVGLSQLTDKLYWDGLASIIIGFILGGTAIWLAYETKSLLIGESASKEINRKVKEMIGQSEGVIQVNEVLTMHMGPDFILATISVNFDDQTKAGNLEEIIASSSAMIKSEIPEIKRIFIEAEQRTIVY